MQSYGWRLAKAAQEHVEKVYMPLVEKAGYDVEGYVNIVEGHASAASIAESVVNFAEDRAADILAVTSHGGCVLCAGHCGADILISNHLSYITVAGSVYGTASKRYWLLPLGMNSHCDRSPQSSLIVFMHSMLTVR
jgi:hypothetical protein